MRTLIFSDSHLNLPFEEKKFNFLRHVIEDADQVIINGDFWEGYKMTFDQFINSPWKHLFPLLKKRKTVYMFGNHDKKIYSDKRANLFSVIQTNRFELKLNGKTLIFEHGNRLYPLLDETHPQLYKLIRPILPLSSVHYLFVRKFGSKLVRSTFAKFNKIIKKKLKKELSKNEVFICGHTHGAEFDLPHQFINTGFIKYGLAQYLLIENKKITPKEEWYD